MDLKQLEFFVAAAEEGSISGAARRLHLSQPPLSRQLRLLEEELGVPLLERSARGVGLTEAGRVLYRRAGRILELSGAAERELEELGRTESATLRLGTISSCGPTLLGPRMRAFCAENPGVRFEVREGNTFELLELLAAGVVELAVTRTPFRSENVDRLYLSEEPMAAAGTEAWMAKLQEERPPMEAWVSDSRKRATLPLSALERVPLIYYRRFEDLLSSCFREANAAPRIFCRNDDARTSLMWAEAGLGVAVVPMTLRGLWPSLRFWELDCPAMRTRVALLRRSGAVLSPAARAFWERFAEAASE